METDELVQLIKQIASETVEEYLNGSDQTQQDQEQDNKAKKTQTRGGRTDTGQTPDKINTDVQFTDFK